jgi:hypothetical protein
MTSPDLRREPSAGRVNAALELAVSVLVVGLLAVFLIGTALSLW